MAANYNSVTELKETATEEGGLAVVTLLDLREMLAFKKLGVRVLNTIAEELISNGLGYYPPELLDSNDQPRQWDEVRIYVKDSALGKIVDAVLSPSTASDTLLLEATSGSDASAAEILDQIRTLLE